ncbi:hypothetical protein EVAR_92243_1 [Eumeta japonica]|uniref:Uncharacterized protein n=1 Tax=Eumeta variegata TaxID=151549 RepID=A0A4C1TMD5_EUMVA|nr:hypothetical protein EVAR_92243_1 [Eumeta japonica]
MSSLYDEVFVAAAKKKGIAMPSFKEAVYNASFVLSNSHVSLGEPVRLPQNFIPVGGYHLDLKTKPLPQNAITNPVNEVNNSERNYVLALQSLGGRRPQWARRRYVPA